MVMDLIVLCTFLLLIEPSLAMTHTLSSYEISSHMKSPKIVTYTFGKSEAPVALVRNPIIATTARPNILLSVNPAYDVQLPPKMLEQPQIYYSSPPTILQQQALQYQNYYYGYLEPCYYYCPPIVRRKK